MHNLRQGSILAAETCDMFTAGIRRQYFRSLASQVKGAPYPPRLDTARLTDTVRFIGFRQFAVFSYFLTLAIVS